MLFDQLRLEVIELPPVMTLLIAPHHHALEDNILLALIAFDKREESDYVETGL